MIRSGVYSAFVIAVAACGARTELESTSPTTDASLDTQKDHAVVDAPNDVPMDVPSDVVNLCGNGVVDFGEECDLGASNSDAPVTFHVAQNGGGFDVLPVVRDKSADAYYDYVGASSHTGLEIVNESRLYLFVDSTTHDLSFVINHNIFGAGSGSAKASVTLPAGFTIVRSDEPKELFATSSTTATGNWNWTNNTDGGVMSNLACPASWSITVSETFPKGITSWTWINADATRSPLVFGQDVTITSSNRCRTNCTIPTCG